MANDILKSLKILCWWECLLAVGDVWCKRCGQLAGGCVIMLPISVVFASTNSKGRQLRLYFVRLARLLY